MPAWRTRATSTPRSSFVTRGKMRRAPHRPRPHRRSSRPMSERLRQVITMVVAIIAIALTASRSVGQARPDSTGYVTGTVVSSVNGEALARPQVSIAGTTRGTVGDDAGRFTITGLPD